MQWAVLRVSERVLVGATYNGNDIARLDELIQGIDSSGFDGLCGICASQQRDGAALTSWDVVVVEPQELLAVKALESLKNTVTDSPAADSAYDLAFEVKGVSRHGGDVPVSSFDHLVSRDLVANEGEDGHDDVLGDTGHIGARDLSKDQHRRRYTRGRVEMLRTSATVILCLLAALRSTWSEPTPAVTQSRSLGAFSMRSAVR